MTEKEHVVRQFYDAFTAEDVERAAGPIQAVHHATETLGLPRRLRPGTKRVRQRWRGEGTKSGQALHEEGALEGLATKAGLTPEEAGYIELFESYPDLETLLRGVMAAPPMIRAGRALGDDAVRDALTEVFHGFETPTGNYALEEEVRYLIARR